MDFGQILMNVVRIEMTVGSSALTPLDPTHVVVVLATDLLQMESHAMVNDSVVFTTCIIHLYTYNI